MRKPLPDRIAELKARKDKLNTRLSSLEAKAKNDNRKKDTRRKIVVGGAVLAAIEKDPQLASRIRQLLASHVGRANDKEVVADLLAPAPTATHSGR